MDITFFLAKALGMLMTIVGASLIAHPNFFNSIAADYSKNYATIYLGAISALILGILIVLTHNVWIAHWPVIITLLGWLSLIKGAALLLFPAHVKLWMDTYLPKANFRAIGTAYLILGLFLCWMGFGNQV
jgi:hypothetical protein